MFYPQSATALPLADRWDAVVVGGGFYGVSLALELKKRMGRVAVVERESGLLRRASYANQARVHNGYHYPRSILTSMRSRVSYTKFREEFASAIDERFTQIYAVARRLSKVNAQQFSRFCRRIGADIAPAPREIMGLFNPHLVEAAFVVTECAFDARRLEALLVALLDRAGVDVMLSTEVERLEAVSGNEVRTHFRQPAGSGILATQHVFNCTYSGINQLLRVSGLRTVPMKHEFAELALVDLPPDLQSLGITVMDGPFFSTMPFPARHLHSLSHVRFTPHHTWSESGGDSADDYGRTLIDNPPQSSFSYMLRDAARYVPLLADMKYRESLWEVKTILPSSELDDSRPVLLHRSPDARNVWSVLGAKIDGVYDVHAILNEALDSHP